MAVITLGGVTLPADLAWPDRYAWQPVVVNTEYSLTGALILQSAEKLSGRPITLQGTNNRAWATRATVEAIRTLQAVADATYTLSLEGQSYTVAIMAVTAEPLWDLAPASNTDYCAMTIEMVEV
jgi:hypothetical protein